MYYEISDFKRDVAKLTEKIDKSAYSAVYGIPRGGVPLAMALSDSLGIPLICSQSLAALPKKEVLVVDDLVDTGRTMSQFDGYDIAVIHVKPHSKVRPKYWLYETQGWITYWWEGEEQKSIEDHIIRLIEFVGEDPTRPGLQETPARVVRAWQEIFSGYRQDPKDLFKVFDEQGYNELVWIRDIEFFSTCEHHLLPFYGRAHVAYIAADDRVIGASKLARLVDLFSRRMTTQERIAMQVADTLMEHLKPLGAACIIEGVHLCMRCRGVNKQNSVMGTSCLRGVFLEDSQRGQAARSELVSLLNRGYYVKT